MTIQIELSGSERFYYSTGRKLHDDLLYESAAVDCVSN
jgi:hypothetical protein